jgi:hypothetical protein
MAAKVAPKTLPPLQRRPSIKYDDQAIEVENVGGTPFVSV